ncbi:MAG: hypothetical protein OEU09_11830 [Rhodospirillales bacterium]|nr:hypothetical protein [Rhodospirillales bacterium]MDH3920382.1 hypothetical protein [Rhodospirillales bacterium]
MSEQDRRKERDAELWHRLRERSRVITAEEGSHEMPDAMALAAYLDGTLDERAREGGEAWLATAPEGLDLLLAAREALAEPGAAAPEALVRRAAALVPDPPGRWLAGRLRGVFMPLWQPLGWSGAVAGVLLACVVGFQLGQSGYRSTVALEQLEIADAGFVFDPADEEIL